MTRGKAVFLLVAMGMALGFGSLLSDVPVELLLSKGAEVDAKDVYERTPLHYAVQQGSMGVIEMLLSKGAEVNARDNDGGTPLHYAVATDYPDKAELLLKKGAEVNAKTDNGKTPLDLAKTSTMKALLLKYGAKYWRPGRPRRLWPSFPFRPPLAL